MYRFLATPRWLGLAALALILAAVMAGLGNWQLHRYHERSAINARIDAGGSGPAVPITSVLTAPAGTGARVGPPLPATAEWKRVEVTGRYDPGHEILARGRTVDGSVGFEVLTPLLLADGSAVLVDRGWLPPPTGGDALAMPDVPPAPSDEVTVVGPIRRPESGADKPVRHTVRRVSPATLGLPYPVYGGYVMLDEQTPTADSRFTPVPADHENAWMNAGYVVQWWAFAALTLFGYGYLAHREAHADTTTDPDRAATVPV
ncbi:SURF1 family protein [Planosporangium sp. 12N6]|uniref:SURF1 family cytochrome oxidase biogenesis protein n=1 Tax=Planosporangium spinosum TaxID=3402278 RepID=UPI003CF3E3D4